MIFNFMAYMYELELGLNYYLELYIEISIFKGMDIVL